MIPPLLLTPKFTCAAPAPTDTGHTWVETSFSRAGDNISELPDLHGSGLQGCWGVCQRLAERKCCFRTRVLKWVFEMLPPSEFQINVVDCQPVHNEATPSQTPVLSALYGMLEFDGNQYQGFRTPSWLPRPLPATWWGRYGVPLISVPRLGHLVGQQRPLLQFHLCWETQISKVG